MVLGVIHRFALQSYIKYLTCASVCSFFVSLRGGNVLYINVLCGCFFAFLWHCNFRIPFAKPYQRLTEVLMVIGGNLEDDLEEYEIR